MTGVAERPLTRRGFMRGTAALVAARGVYGVLDGLATPARAEAATAVSRFQEQYLIDKLEVVLDNQVTAVVPPVYNDVFTAKLAKARTWDKAALKTAQTRLEAALQKVEAPYPATAAGLTIVIAWGLPYFKSYVSGPWQTKAPLEYGTTRPAVLDAIAFPSDPPDVLLEDNHVAFKIRSDSTDILRSVETQLFGDSTSAAYVGDLFDLTSKRIGFLGRGFNKVSAAKTLALAANVPGADQIPDNSQLMLGFTSTQTAALAPDNLPSFETLPRVTNQFPSGYFAHGCAMHLSHLKLGILDELGNNPSLQRWYGMSYGDRVHAMMSPRNAVPTTGQPVTFPNGPAQVSTLTQVKADAAKGVAGHNSALQTATRLQADVIDNYGRYRPKGTAVPAREDFNTLDNPFSWYIDANGVVQTPPANQPGLHFAVFVPATSKFHAARLAMDGTMPDGTSLGLDPKKMGINSAMHATHRQNLLVPPRAHRSFPLAEVL
jgi:hypothetical protein